MLARLEQLFQNAKTRLGAAEDLEDLNQLRVKMLGRKGEITLLLRGLKDLQAEERARVGKRANEIKAQLEGLIQERAEELQQSQLEKRLKEETIDVTLPGVPLPRGSKHPLTRINEEILQIFTGMGFSVAEGPEVELDYYNFEALNLPPDHPTRDMQDTFFITDDILLRSQTSPVQVRVMEKQRPPVRIIAPGKVYRVDFDATHSPMFHQVEGLLVDEHTTFGDLKGILGAFIEAIFGEGRGIRFRPSFFPFTEPSAEIDVECIMCNGSGCRVCSNTGWLEILGAGMVDPRVLQMVGYEVDRYQGFAFGMGVERIAMLKYGIDDIRLLFENDMRFLNQF